MEEKLVFSSTDMVTAEHICSVLKENDIPFTKKIEGAGDYLAIATGNTFNNETQVFVSEESYSKALDLINVINKTDETTSVEDMPEELKDISAEEEKEMEEMANRTKNHLKNFIKYFVFLPIILVISMLIIMDIIYKLKK